MAGILLGVRKLQEEGGAYHPLPPPPTSVSFHFWHRFFVNDFAPPKLFDASHRLQKQ